ncbi:PAS domain S-box protein [Halobaculum sp. MBLA0147]|uniref:PAS domain S-box protein n=1 Tax=Halobaculum sp. MBLA0147 TaxID=3079934 RepID=UPI00352506DB
MSGVSTDSRRVDLYVADSFADGSPSGADDGLVSAATERFGWTVRTVDRPVGETDGAGGIVAFTDDLDTVDSVLAGGCRGVVVTTEPSVAERVTTLAPSIPVVRWDPTDPPWAFLESRVRGVLDGTEHGAVTTEGVSNGSTAASDPDLLDVDESAAEEPTVDHTPLPTPGESEDADATLASYEQLMDSMGDAVYVLDDEGRFQYVNDAMTELTGHDREAILGEPPGFIKDETAVREAEDALRGMLSSEGPSWASLELDIVCADDSRVPVEDHMTLLPYDEELRGTVGVLRDVTTQKRREAMFDGLLDATHRMMTLDSPVAIAGIAAETADTTLDQELVTLRLATDGELIPVASTASTREELPPRPAYDTDEGPAGEAFTTGETVWREADEIADDQDRGDIDAALYVPLEGHGTLTVGVANGELDDQDRYFVELLAATTERALDRAERERSLRQYRALVEEIDDLAFAVDEEGEFALATEPFAAALGYDRDRLVGEPIETVDGGVVATALDAVGERGEGDDDTVVEEGQLRRHDGEELPVRVSVTPVSTAAFDGAVVAVDDISDLLSARAAVERTQDRFGGLFEALTDPVVELRTSVDADPASATVQRANDDFETVFGTDGHVGDRGDGPTTVRELGVPEAVAETLERAAADACRDCGPTRTEVTIQAGGQTRHFVARDVPYEVDDATHTFVVFTDVTELKRRETHTRVLTRVLRHNLRNEISVVGGFVEQLEQYVDEERAVDAVGRIAEAADDLAALSETAGVVQEILQSDESVKRPVDLERIVHESVSSVRDRHEDVRVDLKVDGVGTVVATEFLEHAVTELVDNAVAHNSSDEPLLHVEVADRGDETVVVVGDDGPPIPEVEWAVVTDRREITQLQHGSGIGLWLVRWVVDDHGGTLELRQNDESGSEVALRLPHSRDDPAGVESA